MSLISRKFQFAYKSYFIFFLVINAIYLSSEQFRFYFKVFLFKNIVSSLMGFGSIAIYMSRTRMKFTDTLEDIVHEKGGYSQTSERLLIFFSYLSIVFSVLLLSFNFSYSLCKVFGYSVDWAHTPMMKR